MPEENDFVIILFILLQVILLDILFILGGTVSTCNPEIYRAPPRFFPDHLYGWRKKKKSLVEVGQSVKKSVLPISSVLYMISIAFLCKKKK